MGLNGLIALTASVNFVFIVSFFPLEVEGAGAAEHNAVREDILFIGAMFVCVWLLCHNPVWCKYSVNSPLHLLYLFL